MLLFTSLLYCLLLIGCCSAQPNITNYVGILTVCTGVLGYCDYERLDIVNFSSQSSFTTQFVSTIYPSAAAGTVGLLFIRTAFDGVYGSYYVYIDDQSTNSAKLWTYSLNSGSVTSANVPRGMTTMSFNSASKMLFVSFGNLLYQMNPSTGSRMQITQLYNAAQNPNYTTNTGVQSTYNAPYYQIMVQSGNSNTDPISCWIIYTVNIATNTTSSTPCFPNFQYLNSALYYTMTYMYQNVSASPVSNFLTGTYNIYGPSYQYVIPRNMTVMKTVANDFAENNWYWTGDYNSFCYNPVTQILWGQYTMPAFEPHHYVGFQVSGPNPESYDVPTVWGLQALTVAWNASDLPPL